MRAWFQVQHLFRRHLFNIQEQDNSQPLYPNGNSRGKDTTRLSKDMFDIKLLEDSLRVCWVMFHEHPQHDFNTQKVPSCDIPDGLQSSK